MKKHFLLPGCLQPYLVDFTEELSEYGYTDRTTEGYYVSVAHFGNWLHKKHIPLKNINCSVVAAFARHRCHCLAGRKTTSCLKNKIYY